MHYHPFEAVRAGMPLIFMAHGMLDRLGGLELPGRCLSIEDARRKIDRIIGGDQAFIDQIRLSQRVLLESMRFDALLPRWEIGLRKIMTDLTLWREGEAQRPKIVKPTRIAVIIPYGYRGGSLRGAILLASALQIGAKKDGKSVELVLLHLDDMDDYPSTDFQDLPSSIKRRGFKWRSLDKDEARRAMRYAGYAEWEPQRAEYLAVDDGIMQLADCDLWVVVSDRISAPLLPLRPVVHMVYDYIQRYMPIFSGDTDHPFIHAVRTATQVWTTTEFTRQDALQYAGVDDRHVVKLPMLAPTFEFRQSNQTSGSSPYFLWSTNPALHKNHEIALRALQLYYEEMNGRLECFVTGLNTDLLPTAPPKHLVQTMVWVRANPTFRRTLHWLGNLLDADYQRLLQSAAFLWHPGRIDNGTFSVVEAASLRVPALSSDYPAMREMDEQFGLNLAWMDATDPRAMALALKEMEEHHELYQAQLPTRERLASQSVERLAARYWEAANACL